MFESDVQDVPQEALTGPLPAESQIARLLHDAYARCAEVTTGEVADYIPALAEADPALFGLSLTEVDGTGHRVGDTAAPFTIQSISKAFVLALVCEAIGHE
ncbi:MAG: glutaminase, partial [Brachybacterium sp.]|uniref:glutaminase n=1 Tax=Brachybacterium sp. TaxID=1891286 RepID=UPI0026478C6D